MALIRRSLLLCSLLVGAAVLAAPGFAATPNVSIKLNNGARGVAVSPYLCASYPFTLGSPHFLVHYESDVGKVGGACDTSRAITQTQAGDALGWAEKAYAAEVGQYGFPAPPSDGALGGDARIDIYMVREDAVLGGVSYPDGAPPSSTGSININTQAGINPITIARQVFHLIQFGIWLPNKPDEFWLLESSAEWMSAKVNDYPDALVANLGPSDMALDCKDPIRTNRCDLLDEIKNGGSSRWPFWESVTRQYGVAFVKEVFQHGAANPAETGVAALSGALATHGANLADTFTNWTIQQLSGTYGLISLDQVKPTVYGSKVQTGTVPLLPIYVPVNHLATRFIQFDRGDGIGAAACFAATLSLTVTLPAGIGARPYFYWNGLNNKPVPLAINGNTASVTLPWDTCTWVGNQGFLSLPNPSTDPTANGALFTVVAKLDVKTDTPGQASARPDPIKVSGPVIPVTGADVAPTLLLFGPELLRLDEGAPTVRLIMRSSGEGQVRASLGSTVLGTVSVRPGGNDVRFTIPKSLLNGLRRSSSAGGNLLTLTPLSPSGATTGKPVTRTVSVTTTKPKAVVKKKLVKKR